MKAELIDGYYFVTSDNNGLLGEKDEEIMRFSKEEFESFIDNFVLARALNNTIGVKDDNPSYLQDYPVGLSHLSSVSIGKD